MNRVFLGKELRRFLLEDLGHVEVPASTHDRPVPFHIEAEETGVACGLSLVVPTLQLLACRPEQVSAEICLADGEAMKPERRVLAGSCPPEVLRHGIRVALNLAQVLSGIATNTARLAEIVKPYGCTLLDTRKTTPGFRAFERHAVRTGGGRNHRFNRTDGTIVKKEDIVLDGGIAAAVARAARETGFLSGIEVEAETLAEVRAAVACTDVTHLMLDNMEPELVKEALGLVPPHLKVEASGVPENRLAEYAQTGVRFISTSALVRSARPIKMRMKLPKSS